MTKEFYTDKKYWQDYYSQANVEHDTIKLICGRFDWFWDKSVNSCDTPPKSVIEIGAYPGRYIAYVAGRYKLEATALDYNPDRKKIEAAFHAMRIQNYEIIQADFLNYHPKKQYDLVISNGFIEHFENFDKILDLHCNYLAPGGAMLVMIPNKRYLRRWYGWLLDYDNLRAHNLKCMKISTFKNFSARNNLDIVYLNYLGGFAHKVHQPLSFFQKLIYYPVKWLSNKLEPLLASNPKKWWSGTIICILKKRCE